MKNRVYPTAEEAQMMLENAVDYEIDVWWFPVKVTVYYVGFMFSTLN